MDDRLIQRCRVGDSAAIENFVRTYQQDVDRLALSILDNAGEAEDATHRFSLSRGSRREWSQFRRILATGP